MPLGIGTWTAIRNDLPSFAFSLTIHGHSIKHDSNARIVAAMNLMSPQSNVDDGNQAVRTRELIYVANLKYEPINNQYPNEAEDTPPTNFCAITNSQ